MKRLKLLHISTFTKKQSIYFNYHFEQDIILRRQYVFPFFGLQEKYWVFTVPFFEYRFLAYELIGGLFPLFILSCSCIIGSYAPFKSQGQRIAFVMLHFFYFFLAGTLTMSFYHAFAKLLTLLFGKNMKGVVTGQENYPNSEGEDTVIHTIQIADGPQVYLKTPASQSFVVSRELMLKIHPDLVPYVVKTGWFENVFLAALMLFVCCVFFGGLIGVVVMLWWLGIFP